MHVPLLRAISLTIATFVVAFIGAFIFLMAQAIAAERHQNTETLRESAINETQSAPIHNSASRP